MKILILLLVSLSAQASLQSIELASQSKKLKRLETNLKEDGYELRTIADLEAGSAVQNRCGCVNYRIEFQRFQKQTDQTWATETKEFSLEIGPDGETLVDLSR